MRKPWETDLIFRQRSGLQVLLKHASAQSENQLSSAELHELAKLLKLQTGTGGWELMHVLHTAVTAQVGCAAVLPCLYMRCHVQCVGMYYVDHTAAAGCYANSKDQLIMASLHELA